MSVGEVNKSNNFGETTVIGLLRNNKAVIQFKDTGSVTIKDRGRDKVW